jgi:hypothetical protein
MLQAVEDAMSERWSNTDELLATLIELIDGWRLMWARANVKKGTKLPEPVRIRRPHERDVQPERVSPGELMRRLST